MLEFLKILFFSKFVLLTPNPVSFEDEYVLTLQEPISAINDGGHIVIDVTLMMPDKVQGNLIREFNLLSDKFPTDSMMATLINSKTGDKVLLTRIGFANNEKKAKVYIMSDTGVPVEMEFDTVRINTLVPLNNVTVGWTNHYK